MAIDYDTLALAGDSTGANRPLSLEGLDFTSMPRFNLQPQRGNWLTAGLSAGVDELQGLGGSAVQAAGKLIGSQGLQDWGAEVAARNAAEAQASGRPDLEVAPWKEGGASFLPWLGYQAAKQVPLMGGMLVGGALGSALIPEAAIPAAVARAAGAGAELLGAEAGTSGVNVARQAIGSTIAGYPVGVGSMYQQAAEREQAGGAPADWGDAAKAALLGVPYAAMEAVEPTQIRALAGAAAGVAEKTAKNVALDVFKAGAKASINEGVTEAAQTSLEQSFRPDLSTADKAKNIVDAALTGAAVGGVFGGAAKTTGLVRAIKTADPSSVSDEVLSGSVDEVVAPPAPPAEAPAPAASAPEPMAVPETPTERAMATPGPLTPPVEEPTGQMTLPGMAPEQAPASPFAEQSDADVRKALRQVEKKMQKGGATQEDAQLRSMLLDEVEARAAAQPEKQTRDQLSLFKGKPPAFKQPEAAPATPITDTLKEAKINHTQWTRQLEKLPPEQHEQAIAERLQAQGDKVRPAEVVLGQKFGFLDEKGNPTEKLTGPLTAEAAPVTESVAPTTPTAAAPTAEELLSFEGPTAPAVMGNPITEQSQAVGEAPAAPDPETILATPAGKRRTRGGKRAIQVGRATQNDVLGNAAVGGEVPGGYAEGNAAAIQSPVEGPRASAVESQGQVGSSEGQGQVGPAAEGQRQDAVPTQEIDDEAEPAKTSRFKAMAAASANFELLRAAATEARNKALSNGYSEAEADKVYNTFMAKKVSELSMREGQAERTQQDAELETMIGSGATSDKLQDYLAEKHEDEGMRRLASRLKQLGVNPEVRLADQLEVPAEYQREGRTAAGAYDPANNRVDVADRGSVAQTLFHEWTHAATMKAMEARTPAAQRVEKIFDRVKDQLGERYAATNAREFLSEAYSNPEVRDLLRSMPAETGSTLRNMWESFKDAVARLLRIPATARTAFDSVMEAGDRLMEENQQVEAPAAQSQTVPRMADTAKKAATKAVDALVKAQKKPEWRKLATNAMLYVTSTQHLERIFGSLFRVNGKDGLGDLMAAHRMRTSIVERFSQMVAPVVARTQQLSPDLAKTFNNIMMATKNGITAGKSWAAQKHLHGAPNEAELRKLVDDVNRDYDRLRQSGNLKLYEDMKALNEAQHYAHQLSVLHRLVVDNPAVATAMGVSTTDPVDKFMETPALHQDAQRARTYFKNELDKLVAAVEGYVQPMQQELDKFNEAQAVDKDGKRIAKAPYKGPLEEKGKAEQTQRRIGPLQGQLMAIRNSQAAIDQAPYFHLPRTGNYFVAFTLKPGADGEGVDRAAQLEVEKALVEKGFDNVELSRGHTKTGVFIRVESEAAMEELYKTISELAAKKDGPVLSEEGKEPKRGERGDSMIRERVAPAWLEQYIEALKNNPDFNAPPGASKEEKAALEAERERMVSTARELWLDMLPDTALAKVMVQRRNVPGHSKDMLRGFAFRLNLGVNAMANLTTQRKINSALGTMREAILEAQRDPKADPVKMQRIFSEISKRESQPMRTGYDIFDQLKAIDGAWYLAMNPAYVLTNLTQPGTLLLPELGAEHGFMKAAKTMAANTGAAFNVMRTVFNEGRKQGGTRFADATITETALDQVKDPAKREFLQRMINAGLLDFGGAARELARAAEGRVQDNFDTAMRVAGFMGAYSEVFTRLHAAMAAYDLFKNKSDQAALDRYATKIVDDTMLNYASWNTARAFGKQGVANKLTPLMFQFQNYQFQVLEKLYREAAAALDFKTEEGARARRFLGAHMMAMTVIAGTLGMPFASVLARAADALRDLWDDDKEPHDTKSDWRNFLADVFGKDMGEIIARGVPRALNVDMSGRAGEQDILPLSRFLTDRRKWEDAAKDFKAQAWGAPSSMIGNIASGGMKLAEGDILEGMIEMVPNVLKGPLKAFRMTEKGYVDSHGNKLPLEPGAADYLAQAVGFTPSAAANYSEKNFAQLQRQAVLKREAEGYRKPLVEAIQEGDRDRARELMPDAVAFDRRNPAYAVLPSLGSTIRSQAVKRAQSEALDLPLSTNIKDRGARELTRY